jgi:hypothetical protein
MAMALGVEPSLDQRIGEGNLRECARGWTRLYLHSEELRREINEGLNVIEQWNSANDFIFFARRGEMASNRHEDHEISMLALHLLQNCMV